MARKPTYEELQRRVKELEEKAVEHEQANKTLREGEERFRSFAQVLPIGLFATDVEGNPFYWNDRLCEITGLSTEEIKGKGWLNAIHPEDREMVLSKWQESVKEPVDYELEHRFKDREGHTVWGIVQATPMKGSKGKITGYIGSITDITERKRAEEALRESESTYRMLIESTNSFVFSVDADGVFNFVNRFWSEKVGYPAEEIIGTNGFDLVSADTIEEVEKKFAKVVKGDFVGDVEFRSKTKEGGFIDVLVNLTPICDSSGKLVQILGTGIDVTERKRAEEGLRDEAVRRRILIEQSRDGIVVVDQEGKVYEANQRYADMLGYSMEELYQLHVWDWDTQWTQEQLLEMILAVDDTGDHFETRHRRKDGTFYDVEISTNGAVYGGQKLVFCVCRDITERKKAERALQESERLLNRVGDIAKIGGWEMDLEKGGEATWTKGIYDIGEIETGEPIPGLHEHTEWYLPEYREMIKKKIEDLVETRQPMQFEAMVKTKKGNLKWCQAIGEVVEKDGKVVKLRGIFQDITERKRAEEELKQTSQRLLKAQSIGKTGFIEWNIKTDEVYWSDEIYNLYGIDSEVKPTIDFLMSVVHPDDLEYLQKNLDLTLKGEQEYNIDHRVVRVDNGEVIWVHAQAEMIFDTDGNPQSISGSVVDITERKQAEEELRDSERKLREAQRLGTIGNWEFDPKTEEIIWSDEVFRLFERDPSKGPPNYEENMTYYHPEDSMRLQQQVKTAIEEGVSAEDDYHVILPSGSSAWHHGTIHAVKSNTGEVVKLVGTVQEITERKQAEEEVRESEAFLNAILNSIADPICIKDEKHRWALVNDKFCEISGISRQGLLGKSDYDYFPKAEADVFWMMDEEVLETGKENFSEECLTNATSGRTIFLHTKKNLYESAKGAKFIVAIGRDVTEQKMAEEGLRQAHKMEAIGTLAGGIAHDFNNILAAMIGYTEMAMESTSDRATVQTDLHEVLKAGVRAKELVYQILTFSRQTEHEAKPVKVKLMVREATRLLRASIPTTIEMMPSLLSDSSVMADPTQIHQVVMNLCTNAAHAMEDKGGVLEVSLEDVLLDADFTAQHPDVSPGLYVRLMVSDTGHGMDPETLSRVFEPYFSTKEKGEGTGLGLSVVHGIVKSHGGAVTVYSEPGQGTTFHVYLPVVEREAQPETATEQVLPTGSETILFVDDEPSLVNVGKQMLEGLGYRVVTRTSSLEALEVFRREPRRFDLVVTDMTMPTMTGDQLATELMKIRSDISVVLCTGFSAKISEQKAKAIGIRAFVMKPFLKKNLAETVRKVLDEK